MSASALVEACFSEPLAKANICAPLPSIAWTGQDRQKSALISYKKGLSDSEAQSVSCCPNSP